MSAYLVAASWSLVAAEGIRRARRRLVPPSQPRAEVAISAELGRRWRKHASLRWATALAADDDKALGQILVAGCLIAALQPALGVLVVSAGAVARVRHARRRNAPSAAAPLEFAAMLDLLLVATAAGHGFVGAIAALPGGLDAPFDEAATEACELLSAGAQLATAVSALCEPAGELGRRVATAIDDTHRDGGSISATLVRASDDVTALGRRDAEARARRLPVQLLFPLVSCILPAFALLTVVPLLAGSIGSLPF